MRAAADWLERCDQLGRDVFTRGLSGGVGAGRAPRTMDVTALLRACLAAIRLPPDAGSLYRLPVMPPWSVGDAATRIRALLPGVGEEGAALAAFLPELPALVAEPERWCRAAVASTFLAGLELTREGTITVQQETTWARILIRQASMIVAEAAARTEAGFRETKQKANAREAPSVPDECVECGNDTPREQNSCEPAACTDFLQKQIAWKLEDQVTDEEHAGAEAEGRRRETDSLVHRQRGEAHVHPVEIVGEIADGQERK
jgi:hypothetical protein